MRRRRLRGGSSPLTRGKPRSPASDRHRSRLIPAHAGKTERAAYPADTSPAHPRSRGENAYPASLTLSIQGSSPLTRGKRGDGSEPWAARRLIPAHAGKTVRGPRSRVARRAHPRSRGENSGERQGGAHRQGSSPLTRGKRSAGLRSSSRWRLIPAHAGKTSMSMSSPQCEGAHPRSRGENPFLMPASAASSGSSPLTRGKHLDGGSVEITGRLIPAHAGKTREGVQVLGKAGAHPRSRGENSERPFHESHLKGSSPLTRGKHVLTHPPRARLGLIPAHAGKTPLGAVPLGTVRAHPRSRGENKSMRYRVDWTQGSSPLTRGKRSAHRRSHHQCGLIPAHAGKTRR